MGCFVASGAVACCSRFLLTGALLMTASYSKVQNGLLDICVGNFWTTAERLGKTTFLTPTAIEMFYLLIKRPLTDDSFAASSAAPFSPFSNELWGTLVATMFIMGVRIKTHAGPRT